ncbi:MAG: 3-hydroxyacyl-CoA dehydrogenase/enoyl-CoA hydratase family protein, partial [Gammaproteobacteria bacterium]|nr:3-hydroxyacyl-CoA dehydrogenase/enoyl-CoA hydratase family protein [Gammaproteobacteria bacterium]
MRKLTRENPLLLTTTRPAPKAVGIIGAGTIGPDIGYYLKSALPGLKLVLIDIDSDALNRAAARINAYADKGEKRGKLSAAQAAAVRKNIVTSTDYAALSGCDWVIEAATENVELKKSIFSQVEAVVDKTTLITSNTSSIPAERLFSHLQHPGRATVTHFFAPAFKNPAVEVIDWPALESELLDYLRYTFCVTGKCPLVTDDKVCFMLDRIFDNWCNDAALLLEDASPAQIDVVAGEFVHAGPFFVLNLANGNPIIIETNTLQMELEGDAYRPAAVFETAGTWDTVKPGETVEVPDELRQRIRDRLLGVLFSQTFDILDRNIGSAADLDLGARLAFAFRQGPLELARDLGAEEVSRIMAAYAGQRPGMPQPRQSIDSYQDFTRHVLEDRVDGCCVITLRRPEALNALHDDMTDEILAIVRRAEADPKVKGIVITGYGTTAFCAGADIDRFVPLLGDHAACVDYARACSRLLVHLDACAKPVVAALNGFALGGGLELAIRCDHVVATGASWMQFPEIT